jgi:hypothetical protein
MLISANKSFAFEKKKHFTFCIREEETFHILKYVLAAQYTNRSRASALQLAKRSSVRVLVWQSTCPTTEVVVQLHLFGRRVRGSRHISGRKSSQDDRPTESRFWSGIGWNVGRTSNRIALPSR